MSKAWQVQEAKARFSEFLEASVREGPQIVTKRGVEAAVLLSIEQWRGLRVMAKPDLKGVVARAGSPYGDAHNAAHSAPSSADIGL